MASLTQIAISTRKTVRYGIYLIIFLIIGRILLGILITIMQNVFPAPPPPPTVQFGKLPKLPFPQSSDIQKLTYTIQTPEGGLPTLASQAKVYFMPSSKPDLLDLDKAKQKAISLGFSENPQELTPTLYKFTAADNLSSFEINIVTSTFTVSYNLNSDQSPLSQQPPTPDAAAAAAKSFLTNANSLPDDLTGNVTQEYLKVQNKQLVTAISLSDANLTKINLFRKDYDKLPAVTQNPDQGNVWFIMSNAQVSEKKIIGVQFYYYPVDETQFATYPLITSDQAFKALQANKAYIANIGQNTNGKVAIRRIYLAYFDPEVASQFYQPVIVFEGDNGFVAYVPAVTSNYYSQ